MNEFKRWVGILLALTIWVGGFLLLRADPTDQQPSTQPTVQQLAEEIRAEAEGTGQLPWPDMSSWEQELDQDLLLDDFTEAYRQAAESNDRETEYRVLQELYASTPSDTVLAHLIEHALYLHYFDDAVAYMSILQEQGNLFEFVTPQTFIQTLFNARELNVRNISNIKTLAHEYAQQGLISEEDKVLFFALVAFSKGDIDNYGYFIEQLTGEHAGRRQSYENAKKTVFSYTDPPLHYLDGLVALDLFQRGYYQLARLSAERILRDDANYILPHQLIAYTSLYTRMRDEAIDHLQQLKDLDQPYLELYQFLQGIAYYYDGRLAESVLQFEHIEDSDLLADTYRYQLLAFAQIEDTDRLARVSNRLLAEDALTPYDFFTIFDTLLYQPTITTGVSNLALELTVELEKYLEACYDQLSDQYGYICLYGQAGIYRLQGEKIRAYRFLQQLVRRYPRKVVYNQLWDLAIDLGMDREAKRRYIKAVLTDRDSVAQDELPQVIEGILSS